MIYSSAKYFLQVIIKISLNSMEKKDQIIKKFLQDDDCKVA